MKKIFLCLIIFQISSETIQGPHLFFQDRSEEIARIEANGFIQCGLCDFKAYGKSGYDEAAICLLVEHLRKTHRIEYPACEQGII